MKINFTVDVNDLFQEAQENAVYSAELDGDEYGYGVTGFESASLSEAVKEKIISKVVDMVDRKAINESVQKLCLRESDLNKGFDELAKENIKSSLERKVNQWLETEIIESNGKDLTFSSHVEREAKEAIDSINKKYKSTSFESTINRIVEEKVSAIISGYEVQIKKEVDLVATSLIQQKVSETLTETFANLMKLNNGLSLK